MAARTYKKYMKKNAPKDFALWKLFVISFKKFLRFGYLPTKKKFNLQTLYCSEKSVQIELSDGFVSYSIDLINKSFSCAFLIKSSNIVPKAAKLSVLSYTVS